MGCAWWLPGTSSSQFEQNIFKPPTRTARWWIWSPSSFAAVRWCIGCFASEAPQPLWFEERMPHDSAGAPELPQCETRCSSRTIRVSLSWGSFGGKRRDSANGGGSMLAKTAKCMLKKASKGIFFQRCCGALLLIPKRSVICGNFTSRRCNWRNTSCNAKKMQTKLSSRTLTVDEGIGWCKRMAWIFGVCLFAPLILADGSPSDAVGPAAAKAKTQVWLVEHRNTNSFEHAAKLGIFSHHTLRLPEVNEVNEVNWLLLTMQNLGRGFMHGVGTACGAAHLYSELRIPGETATDWAKSEAQRSFELSPSENLMSHWKMLLAKSPLSRATAVSESTDSCWLWESYQSMIHTSRMDWMPTGLILTKQPAGEVSLYKPFPTECSRWVLQKCICLLDTRSQWLFGTCLASSYVPSYVKMAHWWMSIRMNIMDYHADHSYVNILRIILYLWIL